MYPLCSLIPGCPGTPPPPLPILDPETPPVREGKKTPTLVIFTSHQNPLPKQLQRRKEKLFPPFLRHALQTDFRFPDSRTIPLTNAGTRNLLNLTLPRFSRNPFYPCLLPQMRRRCRYMSKQEPSCLPIHTVEPRPST